MPASVLPGSSSIRRAAEALAQADFLFIGAGAGASADSGLAVFAQVSQLPALQALGKSYDQVASADSFRKDFDNFAAFWISSQRAYEAASPHAGYELLKKFSSRVQERSDSRGWGDELAAAFRERLSGVAEGHEDSRPSPVFCATSNVDGFFVRAGFAQEDVAEIHGSARNWQCGGIVNDRRPFFPGFLKERCGDELFEPPAVLQRATLAEGSLTLTFDPPLASDGSEWPPRCPRCRTGRMRPNVYLFGDGKGFVDHHRVSKSARLAAWCQAVVQLQKERRAGARDPPRLAILEVGCGLRVPSIRTRCEELFLQSREATSGEGVEFIRINPEYPENELRENGKPSISIKLGGLTALQAIDEAL